MAFGFLKKFGSKEEKIVKDPVCGMEVNPKEAKASLEKNGRAYYFCSSSCKEKFAGGAEKKGGGCC